MSLPARRFIALIVVLSLAGCDLARAQTIADYSRAQRAWLETTMSQSAARATGSAASMPAVQPSTLPAAAPPVPVPARLSSVSVAVAPAVQVSGVFKSGGMAVAEVVVNATAYLLEPGQPVPGTPWMVDAVAVDRVVLARHGNAVARDGDVARRVFSLPAMR